MVEKDENDELIKQNALLLRRSAVQSKYMDFDLAINVINRFV